MIPKPPSVPPDQPHIWLSSSVVPTSGADVAAFVINPTNEDLHYGVSGMFERWSGTAWEPAGTWTTSLDFWGGFGRITQGKASVRLIGLGALAHGVGSAEYFTVPPLPVGWYRVRHGLAAGAMEVTETPLLIPPFERRSAADGLMTVRPSLFPPSGGAAHLIGHAPALGVTTYEDQHRFNSGFDGQVILEQWVDGDWRGREPLDGHPSVEQFHNPDEVTIEIPELPLGTYQLVRHHRAAGDFTRVIWITDSLPTDETS